MDDLFSVWSKILRYGAILFMLPAACTVHAEDQIVRLVNEQGGTLVIDLGARTVTEPDGTFPAKITENTVSWIVSGDKRNIIHGKYGTTTDWTSDTSNSLDRTSLVLSREFTSFCVTSRPDVYHLCTDRNDRKISGRIQFQIAKRAF